MNRNQGNKIAAIIGFLFISIAIFTIQTSVPLGPWHGIHEIFSSAWILLGIAGILFIAATLPRTGTIGAVLIATSIGVMTLQWGTMLGIRDPWIHLATINEGINFGPNPYPAFHAIVQVTSEITGITPLEVMRVSPVFVAALAVFSVSALSNRISNSKSLGSLAVISFLPVVIVEFVERPIMWSSVVLLAGILVVLSPLDQRFRGLMMILLSIVMALFHPLSLLMFWTLTSGVYIARKLGDLPSFPFNVPHSSSASSSIQHWGRVPLVFLLGLLLGIYIIYSSSSGPNIVVGAIAELLQTSSPSEGTGFSSNPLLLGVLDHITEVLARTAVIIFTGLLAFVGVWSPSQNLRNRLLAAGSLLGAGVFIGIFVVIDIAPVGGFAATRAIPLAPVILVLGAIIGLTVIYETSPHVAKTVGIAVLLIGFAIMFPAPWTGTYQTASTSSDIERVDWLVEYKQNAPVLDAQNTYEIAHALYGSDTASELAEGDRWEYQRNRRGEPHVWQIEPPSRNSLIVVHELSRLRANAMGEETEIKQFESSQSRIYSNGNSDIYWFVSS